MHRYPIILLVVVKNNCIWDKLFIFIYMEDKEYKELEILEEGMPPDLKVAIESVVTQVSIMEEYKLEEIPIEYIQNLIDTGIKYPEWDNLTQELLDSLGYDIEFECDGPLGVKDTAN